MGPSVQTWWWQAAGRSRRRHGMIVFRIRNGSERRAGIDFDPLRQSFDDVIASMERQVRPARETDDSMEILVQIGDGPLLMSRESHDWPRLARLGSALLREAEEFSRPVCRPVATFATR